MINKEQIAFVSLGQIKGLPFNTSLDRIRGKIRTLFKREPSTRGSYQKGEFVDDTGTVTVHFMISDRDEIPPSWRKKEFEFVAPPNDMQAIVWYENEPTHGRLTIRKQAVFRVVEPERRNRMAQAENPPSLAASSPQPELFPIPPVPAIASADKASIGSANSALENRLYESAVLARKLAPGISARLGFDLDSNAVLQLALFVCAQTQEGRIIVNMPGAVRPALAAIESFLSTATKSTIDDFNNYLRDFKLVTADQTWRDLKDSDVTQADRLIELLAQRKAS